jgi:predicted alpha-1,2-mannosidase
MSSRRRIAAYFAVVLLLLAAASTIGSIRSPALAAADPVALVNPFIGTSGTQQGGPIDTFPGADVPFGMVQWSPDTPSQNAGGGYEYDDHDITGFSLTHLSGPGCSVFGDFASLPTTGTVSDPTHAQQPFSHANEEAQPGWYAVNLDDGVRVALTVTPRTGLGSFAFPATTQANVLVNVSSDQAGVLDAQARIVGDDEIEGSATSGNFCGMPDRFTVYFVERFDRAFAAYGVWRGARLSPGSRYSRGPGSGAWVTFDTTRNAVVEAKVAISYVGVDGALANMNAEDPGWDLAAVRAAAFSQWRDALGRIAIAGGSPTEEATFYTALYHALLHPNVYSDANGEYRGFDGKVHHTRRGHTEYANYSDWDIYRTEMPLLALIEPDRASDMAQSLVDAAKQGGLLPRWALVNAPTSVMGGDSVDAVIAGAYAFGARDFDARAALAAMVRGATRTNLPLEDGWYVERPELPEYLRLGYIVNSHTTSVAPVPNGASETLEYALDDFSIGRLAAALGDAPVYRRFMARSSNWSNLFDTATAEIAPRNEDGAFMQTPIEDSGQSGFQEGNAAQYTWLVPQDLRDLIAGMGGAAAARARLDTFFTQLNAGQNEPYAWLGNEPSLGTPWVYLSIGVPWRTQEIVRKALLSLYGDTPVGLPGNDDLGTMSAWYVWCAIGLYPQNPAVRVLDVGSPLFPSVVVRAPGAPTIDIVAPNAADDAPYVRMLQVNGQTTERTWIDLPLRGSLTLNFTLAAVPDETWGTAPEDAPPSYAAGAVRFPPSSAATLSFPTTVTPIAAGASANVAFTVSNAAGTEPENVTWHVDVPATLRAQPESGSVTVAAHANASVPITVVSSRSATPAYESMRVDASTASGVQLQHVDAVLRVGALSAQIPLAFLENIYDNSVSPVDLSTGTLLPKIPVAASPRDAAFGGDGMLYVADRDGATVSVIDPATRLVVKSIKVGQGPSAITAGPDGTLWFVNAYDGTVQSIDPKTESANPPIPLGGTLRGLAIIGKTIYVTVTSLNEVVPIDMESHAIGTPIAVGAAPQYIAATPDGRRLYVVDNGSDDVTPIDVTTGRALPPIRVGVAPTAIAISADGTTAYVSNDAVDTVAVIDLHTDRVRGTIVTGARPYGLALDPDGKTLWVVNRQDNDVVPVDLATSRAGPPILDLNGPLTLAVPRS